MIVLHILLTILKIIGIILLCILGLILILSFFSVGVLAEYSADGPLVKALAGPVKLQLLPKRQKPETQLDTKPREKQKKQKKKKEKKPKEPKEKPAADTPKEPITQKIGGLVPLFKDLLGLLLEAQGMLRNNLKIKELTIYLTMAGAGDDPAKSAATYGRAWAALGNLWTVLHRTFVIQKRDLQANIDFLSSETRIYARAIARIRIGALLRMGIWYGARAGLAYLRHRRRQKKQKASEPQKTS